MKHKLHAHKKCSSKLWDWFRKLGWFSEPQCCKPTGLSSFLSQCIQIWKQYDIQKSGFFLYNSITENCFSYLQLYFFVLKFDCVFFVFSLFTVSTNTDFPSLLQICFILHHVLDHSKKKPQMLKFFQLCSGKVPEKKLVTTFLILNNLFQGWSESNKFH